MVLRTRVGQDHQVLVTYNPRNPEGTWGWFITVGARILAVGYTDTGEQALSVALTEAHAHLP